MAVTEQFRKDVLEVLDDVGASAEVREDVEPIEDPQSASLDMVTLPGIKEDSNGNFVSYVKAKLGIFYTYVQNQADSIVSTWTTWFGTDATNGVQKQWADIKTDAQTATNGAENVNATISGTKLTVTNRNGVSTSVNTKGEKGDTGSQGPKGDKGDKGDDLHWDEMTEQEKEELADKVLDELVFASVETCEEIVDELI